MLAGEIEVSVETSSNTGKGINQDSFKLGVLFVLSELEKGRKKGQILKDKRIAKMELAKNHISACRKSSLANWRKGKTISNAEVFPLPPDLQPNSLADGILNLYFIDRLKSNILRKIYSNCHSSRVAFLYPQNRHP